MDSLSSTDCADLRRFWKWSHANSVASPLAGNTFFLGYECLTDICVQLNEDSGPVPLIEGTDYTVDKDEGTIFFTEDGTTAFFISNTTTVDVWFNVLACPAAVECRSQPCCDDAGDNVYVATRPPDCTIVPMISFSPSSGTTQSFPVTVTLTANRDDVVIYYTTDGTEPTTDSTKYTAPFALTDCANIIKAMGIVPGCMQGPTNVCQYLCGPPADGMYAWYKSDAESHGDGEQVTTWVDSTLLGNNLQYQDENHPFIYKTGQLNGYPALTVPRPFPIPGVFSGRLERLTIAAGGLDALGVNYGGDQTGFTVLGVIKHTSADDGHSNTVLIFQNYGNSSAEGTLQKDSSVGTITFFGNTNETAAQIDGITLNSWQVISFSFDNTAKIPNLKTNSVSADGSAATTPVTLDSISLQFIWADWVELIFYRKKLSTPELAQARNYLAGKYGIAITV